jgi:hypothetical protein
MNPLGGADWPDARSLAEQLVTQTGTSVRAILLYGSRLLKANPDVHSALDFVVIVDAYRPFYEGLSKTDELHRPVGLMSRLAEVLPPNVIAYAPGGGRGGIAKCLVVRKDHFARALGADPPDHFLLGRMVQRVGVVWSADPSEAAWVAEQMGGAQGRVLDWMSPWLEGSFDAAALGRRLLEVCYSGEFRPESRDRAGRIFEAQSDHFAAALQPGLDRAVQSGRLRRAGALFTLAAPASPAEARRWQRHFRRSKIRTTLRWFKHMVTFANWLPYVVRKVERHTGRTIQLTTLERRLPIIFLWPRAIYVLVTRPRRELPR